MKYMSFIFENQDIRNTVANSEALVEIASKSIIDTNLVLEAYIYENLVDFTASANSAHEVYERIRDFVISENTIAYSQLSEILADSELSTEDKTACFTESAAEYWAATQAKAAEVAAAAQQKAAAVGSSLQQTAGTAMEAGRQKVDALVAGTKNYFGMNPATSVGVSSAPAAPTGETAASAMDHVKTLANAHPVTAAALGAGAAGLGAYGVYRAMKARKAS